MIFVSYVRKHYDQSTVFENEVVNDKIECYEDVIRIEKGLSILDGHFGLNSDTVTILNWKTF